MSDPERDEACEVLAVALVGARGRMGSHALRLLGEHPGFTVAACLGRGECTPGRLSECGATLGLDFTAAGLGAQHGLQMLAAGLRPVIGTSGVSLEENQTLDRTAGELGLGGIVVPNFSAGVWLQQRAAEEAARFFRSVEIIERHGPHKRDAPSGTALDTAERIAGVRDDVERVVPPIHSVRIPGLFSNQEVAFGGRGEVLRIVHETYGLDCFSAGILCALRYARSARGVARGIGVAFQTCGYPAPE